MYVINLFKNTEKRDYLICTLQNLENKNYCESYEVTFIVKLFLHLLSLLLNVINHDRKFTYGLNLKSYYRKQTSLLISTILEQIYFSLLFKHQTQSCLKHNFALLSPNLLCFPYRSSFQLEKINCFLWGILSISNNRNSILVTKMSLKLDCQDQLQFFIVIINELN